MRQTETTQQAGGDPAGFSYPCPLHGPMSEDIKEIRADIKDLKGMLTQGLLDTRDLVITQMGALGSEIGQLKILHGQDMLAANQYANGKAGEVKGGLEKRLEVVEKQQRGYDTRSKINTWGIVLLLASVLLKTVLDLTGVKL